MIVISKLTKLLDTNSSIRPSHLFFFRLASNAFPDVGSVGRTGKKKPKKKKSQEVLE